MSTKLSGIEYWTVVAGCLLVGFSMGTIFMKGISMPDEPKKISCPNCSGIAFKEGNKINCEFCDATFTITKTGGAKVKEIGRLEKAEKRLDRLDALFPEESDPADPEPNPAGNDSPILGPE